MTEQQALFKYTLRLGDDPLILSYRLSEWCSNAPFLEQDLAMTNFALDMIGRAQAFLKYAGEIEGNERTEDYLAYKRPERQFYNHLITEVPNGDFARSMARQLFISTFEFLLFTELANSTNETIAGIAAKTVKEIKYHFEHAKDWVIRLGDGTEESHRRMQTAIDYLWPFTGELFETDEVDNMMLEQRIGADVKALEPEWLNKINAILGKATLTLPENAFKQTGSRLGIHTEYLGHILSEMQYLQRAYPDAKW